MAIYRMVIALILVLGCGNLLYGQTNTQDQTTGTTTIDTTSNNQQNSGANAGQTGNTNSQTSMDTGIRSNVQGGTGGASITTDDYKRWETYLGYSHMRADRGTGSDDYSSVGRLDNFFDQRKSFNGGELAVTRNFHPYAGLKVDFSMHWNDNEGFLINSAPGGVRSRIMNILGGVQFKDNAADENQGMRPFAHALAGIAHSKDKFRALGGQRGIDDTVDETGFALGVGGGLDVYVTDRLDFRAFQIDYNPNWFDGATRHNFRLGIGLVFH
jgi:hypothetical protein